jgi:hypothetical protein
MLSIGIKKTIKQHTADMDIQTVEVARAIQGYSREGYF